MCSRMYVQYGYVGRPFNLLCVFGSRSWHVSKKSDKILWNAMYSVLRTYSCYSNFENVLTPYGARLSVVSLPCRVLRVVPGAFSRREMDAARLLASDA